MKGNDKFPTLIVSTPQISCIYIQSNEPCKIIPDITNEVLYLWKQNNAAYICTRERLHGGRSAIRLFMISISNINGKVFVSILINQSMKLRPTVDYRIFGAYYYTQSSIKSNGNDDHCITKENQHQIDKNQDIEMKDNDNNGSNKCIKNGFPDDNFLIIISDTDEAGFRRYSNGNSLNIILTQKLCIPFENKLNLQCVWYHRGENKFIGIERKHYHLVSLGLSKALNADEKEKSTLFVIDKYQKITGTGIQHYFFDPDNDTIVIYKTLMASSKFRNELIFLPVSSQLMVTPKKK